MNYYTKCITIYSVIFPHQMFTIPSSDLFLEGTAAPQINKVRNKSKMISSAQFCNCSCEMAPPSSQVQNACQMASMSNTSFGIRLYTMKNTGIDIGGQSCTG